jgi:acyl-CoA synthetase (AMP-forming)/AMP-acid ligase II
MDISRWISDAAARTPTNTAVRFESSELTYGDLEWRVGALAGVLEDAGAASGDRVAYLGPNCPELLEALFACARLGAIFVPLNARMTAAELRLFVEQASPSVLLAEESFWQMAGECAGPRQIPILRFSIGERWEGPRVSPGPHVGASAPVLIFFTSGTTGTPKGAVLTHGALTAHAAGTAEVLRMTATDEVLTVTPMFHVAGLNLLTTPALSIGATVVVHRRFDPAAVLATDGYLHIVDRIKELIIVGVSNVAPADLEAVLADSPHIAAAAVVGRPDDKLGEVPVAFVVRSAGSQLSAEQVLALFDGRVAPYKRPRDVIFLDAMPSTPVGKPEKKALRALTNPSI